MHFVELPVSLRDHSLLILVINVGQSLIEVGILS